MLRIVSTLIRIVSVLYASAALAAGLSAVPPEGDASGEYKIRGVFSGHEAYCALYAERAVLQQNANLDLGCNLSGPEWSAENAYHRNWCLEGGNSTNAVAGDRFRAQLLTRCIAANKKAPGANAGAPAAGAVSSAPVDTDCYISDLVDGGGKTLGYATFLKLQREYLLRTGPADLKYDPKAGLRFRGATYKSLCAGPYLVKGLGCYGRYCSGLTATCCRFTPDYSLSTTRDLSSADERPPLLRAEDSFIENRWSAWFSEEKPRNEAISYDSFMRDAGCKGDYCDQVSILFSRHPDVRNTGNCYWTRDFSEESSSGGAPAETCGRSEFVAGARCIGDYCDNIQLHCCRAEFRAR
ncbi:MAG: hypothetical protein WAT70_04695 [Rhizobiaceae bacterium]